MFVCTQKNVLFTFDNVKREPLSDVLKRFWTVVGILQWRLIIPVPVIEAGHNNKNKLGGKKNNSGARFLERAIFIDLMVQTITFYIGQRGFYLTSAGLCHKSCGAGTEAERVTSPFSWVSSSNCAVSWRTFIRPGSLNWSHFREVREEHRGETRWRLQSGKARRFWTTRRSF